MDILKNDNQNIREIYLAGGCFWGVEAYMSKVLGVVEVTSGYANGDTENPTYEDLIYRNSGHAEAVHVIYDKTIVSLNTILSHYFRIIDPTTLNRQGNDVGTQYRVGIYFVYESDKIIIDSKIKEIQKYYVDPIVVEVIPIREYYLAEEYHQNYLDKNPNGYCHIILSDVSDVVIDSSLYIKENNDILKEKLTLVEYKVSRCNNTEPAFSGEYFDNFDKGLYVDITTGEPLFLSINKFESGCGWPSFTKPIAPEVIVEINDITFNMNRIEVRSRVGNSHLGHVFPDGPSEHGGLRYCINSASLKFINYKEMNNNGYGNLIYLLDGLDVKST